MTLTFFFFEEKVGKQDCYIWEGHVSVLTPSFLLLLPVTDWAWYSLVIIQNWTSDSFQHNFPEKHLKPIGHVPDTEQIASEDTGTHCWITKGNRMVEKHPTTDFLLHHFYTSLSFWKWFEFGFIFIHPSFLHLIAICQQKRHLKKWLHPGSLRSLL